MQSKSTYLALLGLSALMCFRTPAHADSKHKAKPQKADEALAPEVEEYLRNVKRYSEREINLEHFEVKEEDPESNLPTPEEAAGRPAAFAKMIMRMSELGDQARARGDWTKAVKLDRAIVRFGSDKALPFSTLCHDYEKLGKRDEAVKSCALALEKQGVRTEDFARFVGLVLSRPEGLDPIEVEDAKAAIEHLKGADASRLAGYQLQCQLSVVTKDDTALEDCAAQLIKLAPQDRKSVGAAWSVAMKKHDFERAKQLLASAKTAGLSDAELAEMEELTEQKEAEGSLVKSLLRRTNHAMMGWLLGLLVAVVAGVYASRKLVRTHSA
jgi:tetratricopeptide (TPR) repeat protein